MKYFSRISTSIIATFSCLFVLSSCNDVTIGKPDNNEPTIEILDDNPLIMKTDTTQYLRYKVDNYQGQIKLESSKPDVASVDEKGLITAKNLGSTNINIYGENISSSIEVIVVNDSIEIENWGVTVISNKLHVGESAKISKDVYDVGYDYLDNAISIEMISDKSLATLEGNILTAKKVGTVVLVGKLLDFEPKTITVQIIDNIPEPPPIGEDVSILLSADKSLVEPGEKITFKIIVDPIEYYSKTSIVVISAGASVEWLSNTECSFAAKKGEDYATVYFAAVCVDNCGVEHHSNKVAVTWAKGGPAPSSVTLTPESDVFAIGESMLIDFCINSKNDSKKLIINCLNDPSAFEIVYNQITALKSGIFQLQGDVEGVKSNIVKINVVDEDPYKYINENNRDEFYTNYHPAESEVDASLRTKHYLISGDITPQKQEPTIAEFQPQINEKLIHNSSCFYSDSGDIYYVLDSSGSVANEIYKAGAYVSLEEVAAYVYAFGNVPINYQSNPESNSVIKSPWGRYLRLNNCQFSGSATDFPYEPVLPRISGCGGDLIYYEIDIGTTGTDCDPSFPCRIYNNGRDISRGAARIVYTRYYADNTKTMDDNIEITNLDDRYVFYTYNHYNDFQEYLNYLNGWGLMFGNKTAGNELNYATANHPPTKYIETTRSQL